MEVDTVALAANRPGMVDIVEASTEMGVVLEAMRPSFRTPPADETNSKSTMSTMKAVPPVQPGGNQSRHRLLEEKQRSQSHQKRKNQRLTFSASMLKIYLQRRHQKTSLRMERR